MANLKEAKLILENDKLPIGQIVPDFKLTNMELDDVSLKDFSSKQYKLISTFPSINTSVCDLQTKNFNKQFSKKNNFIVLNVSMDLPFALSSWCSANGLNNIVMLSDYKTHNFSKNFGIHIKDFCLIYRAFFILDQNNKLIYSQYANSIGENLNFNEINKFIETL